MELLDAFLSLLPVMRAHQLDHRLDFLGRAVVHAVQRRLALHGGRTHCARFTDTTEIRPKNSVFISIFSKWTPHSLVLRILFEIENLNEKDS